MSGSCITCEAARPEAVSTDTQAWPGKQRDDGWQHFQVRTHPQVKETLERLYESLCLERYSLGERDRLHAALQDACSRFLPDPARSPSACLSLGVRIRSECVTVTLEILGDEGASPSSGCCEAGILHKGFELCWAQYLKVDSHLQLIECRVLH
jgi:hypothetical protein